MTDRASAEQDWPTIIQKKLDGLNQLPCRTDEMTEREGKIIAILSDCVGFMQYMRNHVGTQAARVDPDQYVSIAAYLEQGRELRDVKAQVEQLKTEVEHWRNLCPKHIREHFALPSTERGHG